MEKERGQLEILRGYLGQIEAVGEEEVRGIARGVIGEGKDEKAGRVIGLTMKEIGGRPVDADVVKRVVEELLAEKA